MKQVKIPEDLFLTLVKYHLAGIDPEINEEKIKAGLQEKMNSLIRRQYFTEYKFAADETQRNIAKEKYLDMISAQKTKERI